MKKAGNTFIDLFSGCGGLSLGLAQAGLVGRFAVERDEMAFGTFARNFLELVPPVTPFRWPRWLEQRNWSIEALLQQHATHLSELRGQIDVLAGGPPCQGFSFAGRRQENDPRNLLFEKYVEFVDVVRPAALLLENVPGMRVAHALRVVGPNGREQQSSARPPSYYDRLEERLRGIGYSVLPLLLDASGFGVPQRRQRLIVFGLRNDLRERKEDAIERFQALLEEARIEQTAGLGVPDLISASEAISDLERNGRPLKACTDPWSAPGFLEVTYQGPRTSYQRMLNKGLTESPDSMRLARHRPEVAKRFGQILAECRKGVRMDEKSRRAFGLKKQRIYPMSATEPAPTVTTLPDDILHYSEPRILTVRECARLQSFPDWFQFTGKFTTGGDRRAHECPRYTQVGNAVPPLLGRALGLATVSLLKEIEAAKAISSGQSCEQLAIRA